LWPRGGQQKYGFLATNAATKLRTLGLLAAGQAPRRAASPLWHLLASRAAARARPAAREADRGGRTPPPCPSARATVGPRAPGDAGRCRVDKAWRRRRGRLTYSGVDKGRLFRHERHLMSRLAPVRGWLWAIFAPPRPACAHDAAHDFRHMEEFFPASFMLRAGFEPE
jgi:hypothetical protein